MQTVEEKISRTGPNSFVIALPAIWRRWLELSDKDHVIIEITEEKLTVRPKRQGSNK